MSDQLVAALNALTEQMSRQSDAIEAMLDTNQHLIALLIDAQVDQQADELAEDQDLDC